MTTGEVGESPYGTKGYGGSGQADKASIARMRLVDSIGILVAELVKNGSDFVVVPGRNELSDETLKPGMELVVLRWSKGKYKQQTLERRLSACRRACRSEHAGQPHPWLLCSAQAQSKSGQASKPGRIQSALSKSDSWEKRRQSQRHMCWVRWDGMTDELKAGG